MDRVDYELSLGAGVGVAVVALASFFNILQSSLQIIGIGTAISLGLGAFRLRSERNENRRRLRNERILRLMPTIYNPLWKWAMTSKQTLAKQIPDELNQAVQSPPDLSAEGDFTAIVGEGLRNTVLVATEAAERYYKLSRAVRDEYNEKIGAEFAKLGVAANEMQSVTLISGNSRVPLWDGPFIYTLKSIRDWLAAAPPEAPLSVPRNLSPVPCPDEVLAILKRPDVLPSFAAYEQSRKVLQGLIDSLIGQLKDALANGEKDWKLMT